MTLNNFAYINSPTMRAVPSHLHIVEDRPEGCNELVVATQPSPLLVRPKPIRGVIRPVPVKPVAMKPVAVKPVAVRPVAVKPTPIKPVPVRPIAMKVVRPIPQRISEQFYNEAFQEGIAMKDTNDAAALAHDWHRRWTQQDELNHTMPNEDFYARKSNIPSHYDADLDRQGAMNPSLGDLDDASLPEERFKRSLAPAPIDIDILPEPDFDPLVFNPEDRLSASSWSDSMSSSISSYMAPQVKRRFTGAVPERMASPEPLAVAPMRPIAVRPIAVRLNRTDIPSPHEIPHGGIPKDIFTPSRRIENVSPMSVSEEGSSTMGSENFLMTVMNKQNEVIHVIDQDDETDGIECARDSLLQNLAAAQGDVENKKFLSSLEPLTKHFSQQTIDTRPHLTGTGSIEDMWLSLSKPTYFGCLGENDNGDPMYTMGRMSFDMFSPTNLVCSLQGNFNPVEIVGEEERKELLEKVPKSLREEVESGKTVLRTYHVIAAFTIEPSSALFPDAPNKDVHRPIRGIMTTFGYSLPDPQVENRHSIWFTGGKIEPNNHPRDISDWKRLFTLHPPKHSFGEKAKLLAVKLLMGATVPEKMNEDGTMSYEFTRPLGGHGMAYIDVVYLDETLRIVKGHRGTFFVFSRLPAQG